MRDRIISMASTLFYRNGIRAVGVDRIVSELGIAKASLYRHFPTKEALVVEYLSAWSANVLEAMQGAIGKGRNSAEKRVAEMFKLLELSASDSNYRGCAFLIAAAEHEESAPIKAIVRQHKDAVQKIFFNAVAGQCEKPKELGEMLIMIHDGALSNILIYRDAHAAKVAAKIAAELVAARLPLGVA
jgi:AcrR family transcriptional regulator